MKKYLLTSLTLGIIAATGAAVIGLVNLLTKDQIAENERVATRKGLVSIFGENCEFSNAIDINETDYNYLVCYYVATENENIVGHIFKASGSNDYGKITALIGVNIDYSVEKISLIVNEQSFGSKFVSSWLNPFNAGERDLDDITCGATYSARLVNSMAHQAIDYYASWSKE